MIAAVSQLHSNTTLGSNPAFPLVREGERKKMIIIIVMKCLF